jgi:hypothetical protein
MSEKASTIATWGYSKTGDKVFDLKPGESLPDGYFAHPAMIRGTAAEKQMLADAEKEGLSGHQFQQSEPKAQGQSSPGNGKK